MERAGTHQRIGKSEAMRGIQQRLSENGRFFMDVNHRYNARAYGIVPTVARMLDDALVPGEKNGDVAASWELGAERISTYGHVFTSGNRAACGKRGIEDGRTDCD